VEEIREAEAPPPISEPATPSKTSLSVSRIKKKLVLLFPER
jgi:hypothetical protein